MSVAPIPQHVKTRVLVVDDSPFMRRALGRILQTDDSIEVVGEASNGLEALRRLLELRPDVITMDVEMPRMDGVSAVAEIMRTRPTPVVMVSTLTTAGADTTLRALEAGAVDYVAKPGGMSHELGDVSTALVAAVTTAKHARVGRSRKPATVAPPPPRKPPPDSNEPAARLVVIGASTGGPPALTRVVPHLPASLEAAVLVVQHMPAGFTRALAERLCGLSELPVREAREGDSLTPGRVLVVPGDFHADVLPGRQIHLHQSEPLHGVRPSVDVTLRTAAEVYGTATTTAILTGMGRDGARGASLVEKAGGRVLVQDEETSVIYGMPRAAKEATRRHTECRLEDMANLITHAVRQSVKGHGNE